MWSSTRHRNNAPSTMDQYRLGCFRCTYRYLALGWRNRRRWSRLLFVVLLVTVYFIFIRNAADHSGTVPPGVPEASSMHVVVISSTYFKKPIGNYSANTMVVLVNTEDEITRPFELICTSRNTTSNLTHAAYTVRIARQIAVCKWTQHIVVCPVVEGPLSFAIKENSLADNQTPVEVPFRPAVDQRIGVVACLSPLFFFERWQALIVSLESYRYYGAGIQVYYIQSMLSRIYDLLKTYEAHNVIRIEPWPQLDINDAQYGYDPNMELDMRNQAAAHTDCMLAYKTAADFIIVGDYDDVLYPRFGNTYLEEFRMFLALAPNAAGFQYQRFNANFTTAWSPADYSLSKFVKKTWLTAGDVMGKSVVIPSRVQTVRPHAPGDLHDGYRMAKVPKQLNIMIHFRKWRTVDQGYGFRKGRIRPNTIFNISDFVLDSSFLQAQFQSFIRSTGAIDVFHSLPNETKYFTPMYECYARHVFVRGGISTCAGPVICDIPPFKGLPCAVAKQSYGHGVIGENIILHYRASSSVMVESRSGCSM